VTGNDWRDLRCPALTRKWRYLTGSNLEAVEGLTLAYTVHFTSYKAVARRRRQSRDRKWRHMTSSDRKWPGTGHFTRSHLEVAGEARKLAYTVHFTSYKAVACRRRQSRDGNRHHVTSGDRKWPVSDVIWPEVTWKWLWKAENWSIL